MSKKISFFIVLLVVVVLGIVFYKTSSVKDVTGFEYELLPAVGKVISYTTVPTYGTLEERENYYMIEVYSDKSIKYGYFNDENLQKKVLSDSQYKGIINLAFGEEFGKVPNDIGNKKIMDGSRSHVTLYFLNDISRKIGGINPKNDVYDKLVNLLYEYAK